MAIRLLSSESIDGALTLTGNLTGTSATFAGIITANSSSSGDYVRLYGSSGTGKWDIYGNGANLRISDNQGAGILAVDRGATFGGTIKIGSGSLTNPSTNADDIVIDNGAGVETGMTFASSVASSIRFGQFVNNSIGSIEYIHTGNHLRFITNGTERVRITGVGNVGIGVSPPADHKLQIHNPGESYARFALTNSNTGSASGDGLIFQMETLNSIIKNQEAGYLTFGTSGRETDLHIKSTGEVGIGSTGFTSQMLTIAAGNRDGAIYATSTDANCFASFRDSSSTSNIQYGAIGNNHVFRKDTNEQLRITSAGNIGISGDTSAWALGKTIQINGNYGTINYNGVSAILGIINAYYNGSAYIRQNVGYAGSIDFNTAISGGGFAFRTENTTGAAGDTVTLSTKMAITSAGNVGIGVTPGNTQAITTQITNGLSLFGNNSTPYGFISNNHAWTSPGGDQYLVSNYGASYYKQYEGAHSWATAPSGTAGSTATFTTRMTINNSGDVGIGTTPETAGPTWRTLFIGASATIVSRQAASGYDSIFANNYYVNSSNQDRVRTTGPSSRMFLDGNNIRFQISPSTGVGGSPTWSEIMRIDDSGNVGIGDTGPDYRLAVKKVNAATPAIMVSGAYYGGPRIQTYGLDADPNAWMGLGTDMGGLPYEHSIYFSNKASTGQGVLTIGSYDGTTYSTKMAVWNNGNIGIGTGTTAPNDILDVRSASWATRIQSTADGSYLRISPNQIATFNSANSGSPLYINNSSSGNIIMAGGGGYVGIGITNPQDKLHVNGDAIIGSTRFGDSATASIGTTGYIVANVPASTNGQSAIVEFVASGGGGAYYNVVYSCYNGGGVWYYTKNVVGSGGNIEVAETNGSGSSTLVFYFRATSGSASYTPRVMMRGTPYALVTF